LIVVDLQPSFLKAIHESERVLARSEFLARAAHLLEVPALATVQNPDRMGGLDERFLPLLSRPVESKMAFSCMGCAPFVEALEALGRKQAVLVGIETHICITQTALHLLDKGFQVVVCPDAASSRTLDRHEIGLHRLRDAGVALAHSESVAYEWMGGANHPKFRQALELVKAAG
jgi:nicotinamidase-related amidase